MRMHKAKTISGILIVAMLIAALGVSLTRQYLFAGKHESAHAHATEGQGDRSAPPAPDTALAQRGKDLFLKKCSGCHSATSRSTDPPPGLQGLFERDRLPVSGKPVTNANVRDQLENPYNTMPSFAALATEKVDAIIAYLRGL